VEAHQIDGRRNYSVASTRHPGIDDATEGELEHDIAKPETSLGRFDQVQTPQPRLC